MLSLNVIIPIVIELALGYLMKRVNILDGNTVDKLNNAVFKVFLPLMLFYNVYTTEISEAINAKLLTYALSAVVVFFLLLMLVIPRFVKDNRKRSVLIQGIFRSNFVLFGMPVVTALAKDGNLGVTAILIAFVVPLFNGLAVVCMEYFRGGKTDLKKIFTGILKNPLIIASTLGVVFALLGIRLPPVLSQTVADVAKVATPLSLIVLGASFTFRSVRGYAGYITAGVLGRLVVMPGVLLPIAVLLGFRNLELVSLLAMFASPPAVSSYVMAQQMEGDATLAGQLVVIGSVASVFTVFLWIWGLKSLGLI